MGGRQILPFVPRGCPLVTRPRVRGRQWTCLGEAVVCGMGVGVVCGRLGVGSNCVVRRSQLLIILCGFVLLQCHFFFLDVHYVVCCLLSPGRGDVLGVVLPTVMSAPRLCGHALAESVEFPS